jgi:hypothetical protein
MDTKTQREQIFDLFNRNLGQWVDLPQIMDLGIAQYNSRIFELRGEGHEIHSRSENEGRLRKTWFILLSPTIAGGERFWKCTKGTWVGYQNLLADGLTCPGCKSPVREMREERRNETIFNFEQGNYEWPSYMRHPSPPNWQPRPHPGFSEMMRWARESGRCFNHMIHIKNSYMKHVQIPVEVEP